MVELLSNRADTEELRDLAIQAFIEVTGVHAVCPRYRVERQAPSETPLYRGAGGVIFTLPYG